VTIPVLVTSCDSTSWLLAGFAYLFTIFWGSEQPVIVAGERKPKVRLPDNFTFWSYGKQWPAERWSNGLMRCLKEMDAEIFTLMLDDYWLVRRVDVEGIATLAALVENTPDVLRLDLTDDRQYSGDMTDVGYCDRFDLVSTPGDSPYQMSIQAAIWRKPLLLSVLQPNWSPWEVELSGSPSLHERQDCLVLGTRQRPVRYANVLRQGEWQDAEWQRIPPEQRGHIEERGWHKK
jgi:hypothetical protein